jgi:hypothetical protein
MGKKEEGIRIMERLLHTTLKGMLEFFRFFERKPDLCVQNYGYVSKRTAFGVNQTLFESKYPGQKLPPYDTSNLGASIALAWATYVWEKTRGIYRFDSEFLEELLKSDLEYPIPSEVLKRLPEPCTLIRLPDGFYQEGFQYVFLIQDETPYGRQLVLVFQDGEEEAPEDWDTSYMTIPLDQKWVDEKDVGALNSRVENPAGDYEPPVEGIILPGRTEPVRDAREITAYHHRLAQKILPLAIYLGSYQPDIERVTTDHALKNDPGRPIKHEVGKNVALLMRKTKKEYASKEGRAGEAGRQKAPHYRRPHFRMQLYGKRPAPGEQDQRYHRVTWVSGAFIHNGEGKIPIRNRIVT